MNLQRRWGEGEGLERGCAEGETRVGRGDDVGSLSSGCDGTRGGRVVGGERNGVDGEVGRGVGGGVVGTAGRSGDVGWLAS